MLSGAWFLEVIGAEAQVQEEQMYSVIKVDSVLFKVHFEAVTQRHPRGHFHAQKGVHSGKPLRKADFEPPTSQAICCEPLQRFIFLAKYSIQLPSGIVKAYFFMKIPVMFFPPPPMPSYIHH